VPPISYLNFVITNGVVLVPAYWRPGLPERECEKDAAVRDTLQRLLPDRCVVQINPFEVNRIGRGGMHCMTQQQPLVRQAGGTGGAPPRCHVQAFSAS